MTKARTRARAAASRRTSVPMTLVPTNASRACVATCGLCRVAAWRTVSTPSMQRATHARSSTDPTSSVNGPGMRSSPSAGRPEARNVRIRASPRCPEEPVTRMVILAPIGQNSLRLLGRRGRRINAIGACASVRAQSSARQDGLMINVRGSKAGGRAKSGHSRGHVRQIAQKAFARRICAANEFGRAEERSKEWGE